MHRHLKIWGLRWRCVVAYVVKGGIRVAAGSHAFCAAEKAVGLFFLLFQQAQIK